MTGPGLDPGPFAEYRVAVVLWGDDVLRFASVVLIAALAVPAHAGSDRFKRQTSVLDERAAERTKHATSITPTDVFVPGTPSAELIAKFRPRINSEYESVARDAARRYNIPEDLFLRLVTQESGWNPKALSHKGAIGLAQLMPGTAKALRVNPHDPHENLEGGARYLAEQYRTFRSWRLALAAYNAGPGAVEKYDGVPPYKETRGYVAAILGG